MQAKAPSDFGQLVIAGAMFAEFGSIILAFTLFFSREATNTATKLVLLGGFVLLAVGFAFVVLRLERSKRIADSVVASSGHDRADSRSGAFMLLVAFVALAAVLGLETILGAFIAGVILRLVDGDRMMTHPQFRQKLEASWLWCLYSDLFYCNWHTIRSGSTPLQSFDHCACTDIPCGVITRSGVFQLFSIVRLLAIVVRLSQGFLQATSLSFIVAASQIGIELGFAHKSNRSSAYLCWSAIGPDFSIACAHSLTPCGASFHTGRRACLISLP